MSASIIMGIVVIFVKTLMDLTTVDVIEGLNCHKTIIHAQVTKTKHIIWYSSI